MSVSFQIPALSTHQVGTGTGAIKKNRTAVVPVETALVDVTASVKTFAPVMKNHHMYARPAQIVVHAACKKWNGQAPLDLFIQIYGQETATLLGLKKIPSDSINLTPALLKK